jgi:uncharacterized repeat protein (TIGR02543 family)
MLHNLRFLAKNKVEGSMTNKKPQLNYFFVYMGISITIFFAFVCSFNCSNFYSNLNQAQAQAGSYVFEAVAVTGSQVSGAGGLVQINGGTISDNESMTIAYYTSTTIQAYANVGYEFAGWYSAILGGQLKSRSATFTFHMPGENTSYYAIFTINRFSIAALSSPSGAGNITGAGNHNYGATVTLNASAVNENYQFYRWVENSITVSNNPIYSFTATQNRSLIAEFRVKVSVNVVGGGSVVVDGQQGFTSGYFTQTQNIILQAIPQAGYEFSGWSSASVSTSPTIQVLVGTSAKTYVANFSLIGAHLFVNATEGGSIINSSESATYAEGEVINLIAEPEAGYHFVQWQGKFSGTLQIENAETSYIIMLSDVLRGSVTFTAVFERDYVNLTLHATVNGVITNLGGLVQIEENNPQESVTELLAPERQVLIRAIKQNGYKFVGWYDALTGGMLLSESEEYLLFMPIEEVSYYAVFRLSYWQEYRVTPLGGGTQENPYLIANEKELAWLAYATNTGLNFSSGVFAKLVNHLNLSAYMWEPIGNGATLSVNTKWQGQFDGGGYTITGLQINKAHNQVSYNGLFGSIYGSDAKVVNLGIENASVYLESSSNVYVGVLAGQVERGLIETCYIKNAMVEANNTGAYQYMGGLIGASTNASIQNCYVFATLNSFNTQENASYAGSLLGNHYGSSAIIKNCYSVSQITVNLEQSGQNSIYVGSVAGYHSVGATIQNVYYVLQEPVLLMVGVNNATVLNTEAKTQEELKQFTTYVNENSSWNFQTFWFLPNLNQNEGLPILRGVGNLIVNASSGENGSITPVGQAIYFAGEVVPTYVIRPEPNYRIQFLLVDGEELNYYKNKEEANNYTIPKKVGHTQLYAEFELTPKEPIEIVLLTLLLLTPVVILVYVVVVLIKKRNTRKVRIAGAINKYKKNKEQFFKFRK